MRIVVSDHALMRYLERVMGIDLEPVRKTMIDTVSDAATIGARNHKVGGIIYTLAKEQGHTVIVTVLTNEMRENTRKVHNSRKRSI